MKPLITIVIAAAVGAAGFFFGKNYGENSIVHMKMSKSYVEGNFHFPTAIKLSDAEKRISATLADTGKLETIFIHGDAIYRMYKELRIVSNESEKELPEGVYVGKLTASDRSVSYWAWAAIRDIDGRHEDPDNKFYAWSLEDANYSCICKPCCIKPQ